MGIKMILGERGKENWEKRKRKDGGGGGGRRWRDQSVGKVQPAVGERRGRGRGARGQVGRRKEKEGGREEGENRVSEDHSNINVPGPEKRSGDIP